VVLTKCDKFAKKSLKKVLGANWLAIFRSWENSLEPWMNLFAEAEEREFERVMPLAARMRPETLDQVAGQQHAVGERTLLRCLGESGCIGSIILFGPPGCGRTTIARLLAGRSAYEFRQLKAISTGVKEVRPSATMSCFFCCRKKPPKESSRKLTKSGDRNCESQSNSGNLDEPASSP
jgi:hypothetical protein